MTKTMLIDATHPEETRVAVVDGKKLEEFDVEIANREPLKGNIYLAKVTRVEPSLQACFVEYGGNRHGFLAFSEIHPDYYRIPIADREALMRETQEALDGEHDSDHRGERHHDDRHHERKHRNRGRHGGSAPSNYSAESREGANESEQHAPESGASLGAEAENPSESTSGSPDYSSPEPMYSEASPAIDSPDHDAAMPLASHRDMLRDDAFHRDPEYTHDADETASSDGAAADIDRPTQTLGELVEVAAPEGSVDTMGEAEPATQDDPEVDEENARRRRQRALRRYKIQEVIKRRQILLVQVTKEERGNKGAALTTYLSLAGRYCVLMPNTDRGGGISRRITSLNDRKRLKNIVEDLDVPEGMAVIVRTAGSERSKAEVKRDFEYLMRLWDEIRETTLKSSAPALIYEEASLIKRSIRDLYTREMGDIVVAGVEGYTQAKSFMRMLTPSHAKRVQFYRDPSIPLFQRYQVESQLAAIHNPTVHLRSGGYIVINQTEALVAVDVNSGRATKERNIEETAVKTNAEAAEEIARQLRLRDLAGLIVVDFIDMEESRNNSLVERRMKDSLRNDRARIQIGRISSFGLLEMSRQRLHPSLQEASTEICPHCRGSGRIRSVDSTALHVLRMVEEEITKSFSPGVSVYAPTAVALYILNQKRVSLSQLEMRRGVRIYVNGDDTLVPPDFRLDRIKQLAPGEELPPAMVEAALPPMDVDAEIDIEEDAADEAEDTETGTEVGIEAGGGTESGAATPAAADDEQGNRRRKRRRRRGRGNRFSADEFTETGDSDGNDTASGDAPARVETGSAAGNIAESPDSEEDGDETTDAGEAEAAGEEDGAAGSGDGDPSRRRRRRGRRGGRRRSRRNPESGEGQVGEGVNAEAAEDAAGGGEQPILPRDSEALPPHWRQAGSPAADQPSLETPALENAVMESPRVENSRVENSRVENPRVEAASESRRAPDRSRGERSNPARKEAEAPANEAADENNIRDSGSDDNPGDQTQRRGWWRRLIE